jgi:flagellar basal-body rod protein FlgC
MPDVRPARPLALLPTYPQPVVRPMFRSMAIAASGLSAQRERIEVIANNLANAETTRTDQGGPYRRRVAVLQPATKETPLYGAVRTGPEALRGTVGQPVPPFGVGAFAVPALAGRPFPDAEFPPADDGLHGVRVAQVREDASEGPLVYEPGHPDADANGYVRYPNVSVTDEMIGMMDARRIYEANATVFQSAKAMLKKALEI